MSSVDGILFDCGTSSMQFDDADRGFAVSKDSELDMRMDNSSRYFDCNVYDKAACFRYFMKVS